MKLYHGTNTEHLPAIRKHGLKDPCLAVNEEIAYQYAEAADGAGEPVVIEVDVDPSLLRIDWPSLSEPVGHSGMTGKQMDERVAAMFDKVRVEQPERWNEEHGTAEIPDTEYQVSLDTVGTVKAAGRVPVAGMQESAASIIERYAGSDKERGIWYHGTSSKLLPSILSQGLIPDPKQRAWDKDDADRLSSTSVSLVSYGGIYLTKNLLTAVSSSRRVCLRDKANPLIVVCAMQPRSLIADEDSFTNILKGNGHTYGLLWQYKEFIAPGRDTERAGYLEDAREAWAEKYTAYLAPKAHPELRKRVHALLRGEGYEAMVTRTVSHHLKEGGYSSKHDWEREWPREMQDAGTVPALPTPAEGERVFRRFIDKLTRVLKGVARETTNSFMKTARTEQPIRFSGSNRIIAVVELKGYNGKHGDEGLYDVTVHYGTVPDDFVTQYAERFTKDFKVVQARERGRTIAEVARRGVRRLLGGSVFTP